MDMNIWKISDFASLIGRHVNTVDGWFKSLEEKRLHYVERINNEKVYNQLDMEIAQYINRKRKDKWALEAIFDDLANHFELRPFPIDIGTTDVPQVVDIESLKKTLLDEMKSSFEQMASAQLVEFQKQLPSPEEERLQRFNEIVGRRKVERQLEEEALSMWATKPDSERMKKAGWFRKEEDIDKRNHFVKGYIDDHFEERMKAEFGIS